MKTLQQVEFTLKRRFERIVLELFLPSFMLVAIGYATLFIKLSLLQVGPVKGVRVFTQIGR